MSEKLREVYNDYFESRIDEWTADQTAKGNKSAFINKMRDLTIADAERLRKRSGRDPGNVDKYSTVRHASRILFPHARERFLERQGVDVQKVKNSLEKKGAKLSPKARVTIGFRKVKPGSGVSQKAYYVAQGRKGKRKRYWGYL